MWAWEHTATASLRALGSAVRAGLLGTLALTSGQSLPTMFRIIWTSNFHLNQVDSLQPFHVSKLPDIQKWCDGLFICIVFCTVLGFALESNTGSLWISVNGEWLRNGNPNKGLRAFITLKGSFRDLYPVVGMPMACNRDVRVTIHSTFASLTYTAPEGFLPPTSDICSCSTLFAECLDAPGCLTSKER